MTIRSSMTAQLCGLALFAALSLTAAPAQPPAKSASSSKPDSVMRGFPVVQNYSTLKINNTGAVWTIAQDPRGMIYLGDSSSVILQFDGNRWRQIFLPTGIVRSLAVDAKGRVWVGGLGTVGYLAPNSTGTLHYVSLTDRIPQADRDFTDVWGTVVTPHAVYFQAQQHIFRWDGHTMHVWSPRPGASFQALSEVRGHLYTSQTGIGLQQISGDDLKGLPGGSAYSKWQRVQLTQWTQGRIVVTGYRRPLSLYNGSKAVPFHTTADGYFNDRQIYTALRLRNGELCVNTLSGGLVLLDAQGHVVQILNKDAGLISSQTLTAFQDRQGALWIGSDRGISRVAIHSPISIFSHDLIEDVIRFQGQLYAAAYSSGPALTQIIPDPATGMPIMRPIPGGTEGFRLLDFKDPGDHAPEQLLAATGFGVMQLKGNRLVPAFPDKYGRSYGAYFILQSKQTPSRVFIGYSDGVASMRWEGHTWKYEGRIPNLVYATAYLSQDAHGNLWASGDGHSILRIQVPDSGMKDAKYEVLGAKQGLPGGPAAYAGFVDGSIYAMVQGHNNFYRWNPSTQKFVVDNKFLLPLDEPDVLPTLHTLPDGNIWSESGSSVGQRIGIFIREPDGHFHLSEDRFRALTRFKDYFLRKLSDGYWLTGGTLIRFNPAIHPPPPCPRQHSFARSPPAQKSSSAEPGCPAAPN